jgi:hypothetical protein
MIGVVDIGLMIGVIVIALLVVVVLGVVALFLVLLVVALLVVVGWQYAWYFADTILFRFALVKFGVTTIEDGGWSGSSSS